MEQKQAKAKTQVENDERREGEEKRRERRLRMESLEGRVAPNAIWCD
jgi:hypothetical protein